MNSHASFRLLLVFMLLSLLSPGREIAGRVHAADFQLSNPGIELRRLQICEKCGEPLVVTSIAPGAAVRCPKCQRVQRRLPDSELLVKVYQICPSCSQRLDVSDLKPQEAFRCGACGFEQRVLPEAVYNPPSNAGKGRIPAAVTVDPGASLLPPPENRIPEAIVPGLNAPEKEVLQEYSIEIESNPDDLPEKDTATQELEDINKSQKQPDNAQNSQKPATESSGFQDLPEIDNDIEGDVSILVNGGKIYESAIMRRVLEKFEKLQISSRHTLSVKDKAAFYTKLRAEAEEELINEQLIIQEALREGLSGQSEKSGSNTLTAGRELLISRHAALFTAPSSGDLMKFYKENIRDFSSPDQLILDSIVIYNERSSRRDTRSSDSIAAEIKEKLDKGVDFTLLASRYSEGAFHGEGGRIRKIDSEYISADFLIKPLRQRNSSVKSGDMFGPIDLPACKLFVQVSQIRPGKARSFAAVRQEVAQAAIRENQDRIFNQWLSEIRKAAVIERRK